MIHINVDVAIVGAGIAGCHLAQLLSHADVSVLLVDQRELTKAGPHWINAVPLWMFDEARLTRPVGNELFDLNDRFIIRGPDKNTRLVVDNLGTADVHMGLLGERLKNAFLDGKNNNFLCLNIDQVNFDKNDRLTKIAGVDKKRQRVEITSHLFVDASGIKACLRNKHPKALQFWPATSSNDTCTAAQRMLEIKDRQGAHNFLSKNAVNKKDILADVGSTGGYSLFRVQVDDNFNCVSILAGVRRAPDCPSAYSLVENFIKANPWIGKTIIDGRGIIPLNASYKKLISAGLALLGDAACQVYAAHGSGIGIGLIAAKVLADTIINAKKCSIDLGSTSALINYQKHFHRQMYARLYFSEHFRKFSENLDNIRFTRLFKSGLLNEELIRQSLMERENTIPMSSWKPLLMGIIKSPAIFLSLMPVLSKIVTGKLHGHVLGKL